MLAELNLYEYYQVLRKRKLIIFIVFIGVILTNYIYLKSMPQFYEATATVKVLERKTLGGLLTEYLTWTPGDPMASQATVAKSYPVVERAVKRLILEQPDLLGVGKDAKAQMVSELVINIQGHISTSVEKNTNIINISFADSDPKKAASVVNKVAESFIEENLLEKNREARRVREFIQEQLKELKAKLVSSEQALRDFKETGEAAGIAVSLQNKLADLETEKAKLLRIYTEAHPNVIRLKEEEDLITAQLKSMPEKELQYARLVRDLEINEKIYKNLQEKFEEARIAEIEKASDISLVDPAFISKAPTSKRNVGMFLGMFAALIISFSVGFVVEQLDSSIGTIEGIESFFKLPVLGVIPYIKVDGKKKKIWQKVIPVRASRKDKANDLQSQLIIHYSKASSVLEAYKILRTNVQMDIFKGLMQNKIILISSAGPEEGKSITCANLAIAIAQAGSRVLLIDADLRRTSQYKIFGFAKKDTGLTDLLRDAIQAESVIKTFTDLLMCNLGVDQTLAFPGIDNLNILLAGTVPSLPSELLGSKEMKALLETLKAKFDVIIMDSPPVLAVADTIILASHVDAVILVYKVGRTSRQAIMRAKIQLEAVNVPCKGIVLNNISRQAELRAEYYYHYKRYEYGEKEA